MKKKETRENCGLKFSSRNKIVPASKSHQGFIFLKRELEDPFSFLLLNVENFSYIKG